MADAKACLRAVLAPSRSGWPPAWPVAFRQPSAGGWHRSCAALQVSVYTNIAEGCGRTTSGEFHSSLSVSTGSAFELDAPPPTVGGTRLRRSSRATGTVDRGHQIRKMLHGLMQAIRNKPRR